MKDLLSALIEGFLYIKEMLNLCAIGYLVILLFAVPVPMCWGQHSSVSSIFYCHTILGMDTLSMDKGVNAMSVHICSLTSHDYPSLMEGGSFVTLSLFYS